MSKVLATQKHLPASLSALPGLLSASRPVSWAFGWQAGRRPNTTVAKRYTIASTADTQAGKKHKRLLCLLCLFVAPLLFVPANLYPQLRYVSTPFRDGERLTYKVKWGFIRLGTLHIRQSIVDPFSEDTMHIVLDGRSAAGLPFINVQFLTTALLDVHRPSNIRYELISGPDQRARTLYATDSTGSRAIAMSSEDGLVSRTDTLSADPPFYDGTGLLMFVRCATGSDTTVTLPTVMEHALGNTTITFSSAIEEVRVAAFDGPIRAHPFHGTTDWVGSSFAGMSGRFRGWVSTDDSRRILRAEVQLFLGSAAIELEEIEGK